MAQWEGYAIVIRHGVTQWDKSARVEPGIRKDEGVQERITGWMDLPLRPEGLREVLHTSHALKQIPIDAIASSTLQRALVTARAVAQLHPDAPLRLCPELRAWNTGLYSGQPVQKVKAQLDAAVKVPTTPIPWGETFQEFVTRFLPFVVRLVNDPRLFVIVTHGMNIEVLAKYDETGGTAFTSYSGATAAVKPGEAILITPTGIEELAA